MSPALAMITGDASLTGWTICFGYGLAGVLCVHRCGHVMRLGSFSVRFRALALWGLLAALLLALGLNKQLDLQTTLTRFGRALAFEQGWYQHRRVVQALVIGGLGLAAATATIWMLWKTRQASRRARVAVLGATALVMFVVLRAISFHHLDALLGMDLIGTPLHAMLEISGIACVGLAAAWRHRAEPRPTPA